MKEILFISKIFILMAFYLVVFEAHCTKLAEHVSFPWLILMFFGQALALIYAFLYSLPFDQIISSVFLIGILHIVYIKLTYEPQLKITDQLKEKDILS